MHILLIDDHPVYVDGLKCALSSFFPEMHSSTAYSGEAAVNLVESNDFDIIILDYHLPELDGLDLLKIFKNKKISSPVLLVSAISVVQDTSIIAEAKTAGACGFISKQSPSADIAVAIKQIIQIGEYWPDTVQVKIKKMACVQELHQLSSNLSKRQTEIVTLMEKGYTNKKIAKIISLSPDTVKTHISNIYKKLGVENRAACISKFKE